MSPRLVTLVTAALLGALVVGAGLAWRDRDILAVRFTVPLQTPPASRPTTPAEALAYFQCNRCHVVPAATPTSSSLVTNCVTCHQGLAAGRFERWYPDETVARWRSHLVHLVRTPDLATLPRRVRRAWLIDFLQAPHVVRPLGGAMMPRLSISAVEAALLADALGVHEGGAGASSGGMLAPPGAASSGDAGGSSEAHALAGAQFGAASSGDAGGSSEAHALVGAAFVAASSGDAGGSGEAHTFAQASGAGSGEGALVQASPEARGDASRGAALYAARGCATCHSRGDAPLLRYGAPEFRDAPEARRRAPDLRWVPARMTPGQLRAWLTDPRAVQPDTVMPTFAFTPTELDDLTRFLLTPVVPPAFVEPRAPRRLAREVHYPEVATRLSRHLCFHCHSDLRRPGDQGPGNTGGFGFAGVQLDLATRAGILRGAWRDGGFVASPDRLEDGMPRLVASLLARVGEVQGRPDPRVLGMPLGFPPLPDEDLDLVFTWLEQGAPD